MIGPYYVTTDARRREAWGEPCGSEATAGRVLIDGRAFVLHEAAVEAFIMWDRIREDHDYRLTGSDTGFYNCRHIQHNPNLPMSFHSWGMALDVNWLENPAGNKLVTDIPQAMIDDLLAVRTASGARVFRWGGDWDWDGTWTDHSYVDAMHWEVVAHPLDLKTGIRRGGDVSDHTHTPPPGEVPGWVSEKELKAWEQRSRTKAGTAHYTFYRYDWSWIYARVIRPMENELSLLAGEIRDLQAENDELLSRIEALEENSGGTEFLPKGYTYQAEITVK